MNERDQRGETVDIGRRRLLGAAGAGAVASAFGGALAGGAGSARAAETRTLRWGVVGTGGIANRVAPMIREAEHAELAAVSSRRMATAREFADEHGIAQAFDSWEEMSAWDGVDALYVATPTHVREEICVTAANNGKHVLGEKPFANLASLKRITSACRDNGVGFMDGTHFVHHPRTAHIRGTIDERVGWAWNVDSAFQFGLTDADNIRLRPEFEPYGAIGDAGWYNMRAAVEYLAPEVDVVESSAYMRRHEDTGAALSGSGVMRFSDGSTTTWNCGFESGALIMDLRVSGAGGIVKLDDFVLNRPGATAAYDYLVAAFGGGDSETYEIAADKPAAALMFEDFAAMVADEALFEAGVRASERTQAFLDAAWQSALENEGG